MQEALAPVEVHTPFITRHYHGVLTLSLLVADVISTVLAFVAGFHLRRIIPLPDRAADSMSLSELAPLIVMQTVFVLIAFFFQRMYHRQHTRYSPTELAAIFSGVSIGTLVSIA